MSNISANNTVGNPVSSLISSNKISSSNTIKDNVSKNSPIYSNTSDTTISTINNKQAKVFVTQSTKQSVVPIKSSTDSDNISKDKMNKLTEAELDALAKTSGQEIKNDKDVDSALSKVGTKLKGIFGKKKVQVDYGIPMKSSEGPLDDLSEENEDIEDINVNKLTPENSEYTEKQIETAKELTNNNPKIPGLGLTALKLPDLGYPNITDKMGNIINGIPNVADFKTTQAMYTAMNKLCPEGGFPDLFNFNMNINLYASLMSLAAKLGLTDLLQRLIDCVNFYEKLIDDPLKNVVDDVAFNGDDDTLSIMSSVSGPNVPKKGKHIETLIKNTDTKIKDNISNVMNNWGIGKSDIIGKKIPKSNVEVTSLTKLKKLATPKNKGFMQDWLTKDKYKVFDMLRTNIK
jgi:hypothetical protein